MTAEHAPAADPNDLARLFLERANAGDAAGMVALYTEDAVMALPDGRIVRGHAELLALFTALVADRPRFEAGAQRAALVVDGLALTSTELLDGSVTAEIARRERDGSWRWVVDQPKVS